MKNFMIQFILKFYKAFDLHVALDFYREGKIRMKNFFTTQFFDIILKFYKAFDRLIFGLCTVKVKST